MNDELGTFGEYLSAVYKRYNELTELLAAPEILGDGRLWQTYSREHAELERTALTYRAYSECKELYECYKKELESCRDPNQKEKLEAELALLGKELEELRAELLLGGSAKREERQSVIAELTSSSRESGGFALDLLNAYKAFARGAGLTFRIEREEGYPSGGVKEAVVRIEGEGARDYLVNESGVHRANLEGGKSVSVAVAVYGAPDAGDYVVKESEISIDLFHASGAGGQNVNKVETAVRARHIPTGILVVCKDERSQLMNRNRAVGELKERVREYYKKLKEEAALEEKNKARSYAQRVRTYDYPSMTITDLRLNTTVPFTGGTIELTKLIRMLGLTLKRK